MINKQAVKNTYEKKKYAYEKKIKKISANLADLLALPCRIGAFSCALPENEEEKPPSPH
jgi:hypothetical protein